VINLSSHPKVPRDIIGAFNLYSAATLDACFDREPMPHHQICLSDKLLPELQEVNEFIVREYRTAWANAKFKFKFMFAGPTVNIAKKAIINKRTGHTFPAPRRTAEDAFTQRFVNYNHETLTGEEYSMMMPIDIDQTGALEKFVAILVENGLPLPLIIKNRVSGRFQAHYYFNKFMPWDVLWAIRERFNTLLTSRDIKVDCSKYRNTRNAFFNPYVMDAETGELVPQKGYTNAKDLSKDFKQLQFQAHNAELVLFDDFKYVEIQDFAPLFEDDDEVEQEQSTQLKGVTRVRTGRRVKAKTSIGTLEECFSSGVKEQWLRYTKQYFEIDDYPSLDFLIKHPSTVAEGSRYHHMVMVVKTALAKVVNLTLNSKNNWGTLPTGFEASVRPTLIEAVRAQFPNHSDHDVEYQADYMLKNTVPHMIATWDEEKAGNGGRKFWSANRWAGVSQCQELNKQYMERTGMKNSRFYNLKKAGRIDSIKKFGKDMLVTLSSVKIVVNHEELGNKHKEKMNLVEQQQHNIKYHLPPDEDRHLFKDLNLMEVERPPPIPPPKVLITLNARQLIELWD
jgi:hypothetical protein